MTPRRARALGARAVVVLLALPFAAPLAYLAARNAEEGGLGATLADGSLLGPLGRSLLLASAVAAAAAVLGSAAAFLVTRTDLPGRRVLAVLLALPLVLPSFIGAFALIAAFARGGLMERVLGVPGLGRVGGFWWAFGGLALLTYPYVYLPVAARLRGLARAGEESARLLGRGPLRTVAGVVVPQAWSAVLAGALLAFLYTLGDFGAVQLLRYETLTRAIYANRLLDPATSVALALTLGALAVAVVVAERALARRAPRDARRTGPPSRYALGPWRPAALLGVGALVGLSLAAPLAVLGYWAARGWTEGSGRAGSIVDDPTRLVEPALNTTLASVVAAAVAVAVVLPVALHAVRRRGPLGAACNGVIVGAFALPGLVIALALVAVTLSAPEPLGALYQTLPLLIAGYVLHFGALALGGAQVAVASVPARLEEAAQTLGRGRLRRFVGVELPLMAPGLAAAGGLVLLSVMKELPATLLLAPAGFPTLATRVWGLAESAYWVDASLAALVLVAVSGVLTWLLVIRRGQALGEEAPEGVASS
jgi:iron(III) transport system permease protein